MLCANYWQIISTQACATAAMAAMRREITRSMEKKAEVRGLLRRAILMGVGSLWKRRKRMQSRRTTGKKTKTVGVGGKGIRVGARECKQTYRQIDRHHIVCVSYNSDCDYLLLVDCQ